MLAEEDVVSIKGKRSKRPRPSSDDLSGGGALSDVISGSSIHNYDERGEDEDMANCLILLAKGQKPPAPPAAAAVTNHQCKTCNKSFSSFQALGGHRAGHNKKPPSNKTVLALGESTILSLRMPTIRVHECAMCGAEFSSGQALGGHMRRHRAAAAIVSGSPDQDKRARTILSLDLNLPAPEDNDDDDDHQRENNKFAFSAPQEQIIVFSATSSLVDCYF